MPAPPWPEKGTEAYEARIAAMVAGRARAKAKKKTVKKVSTGQGKTTVAREMILEADDTGLIDVGTPSPVAMGGDTPKPAERRKQRKEEFDEEDVCKHVGMVFSMLGSIPGHEHWHREADEVALIGQPATRCLNRLDPELRSRVRELSDPAALVIACCWVIGPSLVKEISDARSNRQLRQQPQQYQAEARNGAGSPHQGVPSPVPTGGAQPTPNAFGIPPIGI